MSCSSNEYKTAERNLDALLATLRQITDIPKTPTVVVKNKDGSISVYHVHNDHLCGLTMTELYSDDFKILDDIASTTTSTTYTQSMLEDDIPALKKCIKHAKNPLEKRRYEQLLNKAYKNEKKEKNELRRKT